MQPARPNPFAPLFAPLQPRRCAACGAEVGARATFAGGRFFCSNDCFDRWLRAIERAAAAS